MPGGTIWTEQVYPDRQQVVAVLGTDRSFGCHASGSIRLWFEEHGWTFPDVPEMPGYVKALLECTEAYFDADFSLDDGDFEAARRTLGLFESRAQDCANTQPALAECIGLYARKLQQAIDFQEAGRDKPLDRVPDDEEPES